ncbi:MAG: TolC family protein [Chloroflexi bacterium]|nr:TolC family protein [Chloroflexota bacterium]
MSTRLDTVIEKIKAEVKTLTNDEFDVRFPLTKRIHGNWQIGNIQAAFSTLYADPQVDIVIALGFGAATIAVGLDHYPKPTLAAMILNELLSDAPRSGIASGIDNLAYISIQAELANEIKTFRRVTNFNKVAILADALMVEAMPNLRAEVMRLSGQLDVQLLPVLHNGQDNLLNQLPEDIDAVMIGALPRLNEAEHTALLQELTKRGLPSYSLTGSDLVELGALVTGLPAQNWQRRIRRLALQVQGILLGDNPRDMKVAIDTKRRLVINMKTARELGLSLSFDVLLEAQTLFEDEQNNDTQLWTLNQVAQTVIAYNLDVLASKMGQAAGAKMVGQAWALLFPQLSLSVDQDLNNEDNAKVMANGIARHSGSVSLNINQVIFDESLLANLDIESAQQAAREANTRQTLLDAVQDASVAFLNVLNAQTQRDVSLEALKLSRRNLELAQDKANSGAASNADVFRWQSEVADAKTDLLDANAALNQAKVELNQVLGRPLDEAFHIQPARLGNPALIISDPQMVNLIENDAQFKRFEKTLVKHGLAASPEIAVFRAQLVAQARQLKSSRRVRRLPKLNFNGSLTKTYDDSRSGMASARGNDDWRVGLNLSWSLFKGGGISKRIAEDQFTLRQLQLELADLQRSIEQNIRAQLHNARASKLSIDLRHASAIATAKNLDLVQDSYSQGEADVINLIDAQNSLINANLRASQSVYQFLIDLMNLQRATGSFDFFLDDDQRQARIRSIKSDVKGE